MRLRQCRLHGRPRSQAQLAISADETDWFLLNASPDLRYQIESFPPLHPQGSHLRHSPIAAILLPSAELDAALGLLLLRESQPLTIYATPAVRQILVCDNSLFQVLRRVPGQTRWIDVSPGSRFELGDSAIQCRAFSAAGSFPGFAPEHRIRNLDAGEAVLGFIFEHNGARIAICPAAPYPDPDWFNELEARDVLFFDGTFWSDDEPVHLSIGAKTGRQMGHYPVEDSLSTLAGIKGRKIFIHINNTNPILDEDSKEYRQVRDAGWELAFDGMDLIL
jgi:pyrroloquinoline quinone biosynthesis protein B